MVLPKVCLFCPEGAARREAEPRAENSIVSDRLKTPSGAGVKEAAGIG